VSQDKHVHNNLPPPPALTDPAAMASQQALLQQQLSVLAYSPYGDSPLFRNPLTDPKKKEEVSELQGVGADALLKLNSYLVLKSSTIKCSKTFFIECYARTVKFIVNITQNQM